MEGFHGGGGSGGGSINLFYKVNVTKGTILVNGGTKGNAQSVISTTVGYDYGYAGGNGGSGCITIGNISTGTFVKDE